MNTNNRIGIPRIRILDGCPVAMFDFGIDYHGISRHESFKLHLQYYPKEQWPKAVDWIAPEIKEIK